MDGGVLPFQIACAQLAKKRAFMFTERRVLRCGGPVLSIYHFFSSTERVADPPKI